MFMATEPPWWWRENESGAQEMHAFVSSTNFSNLPVMPVLEFPSGKALGYVVSGEDMLVSNLRVLDASASFHTTGIRREGMMPL